MQLKRKYPVNTDCFKSVPQLINRRQYNQIERVHNTQMMSCSCKVCQNNTVLKWFLFTVLYIFGSVTHG